MAKLPSFDMGESFATYAKTVIAASKGVSVHIQRNIPLVAEVRPKLTELVAEKVDGRLPAFVYYIEGEVRSLHGPVDVYTNLGVDELEFSSGRVGNIEYRPPYVKMRYAFTNAESAELVMKGATGQDFDENPKALSVAGTYRVPVDCNLAIVTSKEAGEDIPVVFASIDNAGCLSIDHNMLGVHLADYFEQAPTADPETIMLPKDILNRSISSVYGFDTLAEIMDKDDSWVITADEHELSTEQRAAHARRLEDSFDMASLFEKVFDDLDVALLENSPKVEVEEEIVFGADILENSINDSFVSSVLVESILGDKPLEAKLEEKATVKGDHVKAPTKARHTARPSRPRQVSKQKQETPLESVVTEAPQDMKADEVIDIAYQSAPRAEEKPAAVLQADVPIAPVSQSAQPQASEKDEKSNDVNDVVARLSNMWGDVHSDEAVEESQKSRIANATKLTQQSVTQQTIKRVQKHEEQKVEDAAEKDAHAGKHAAKGDVDFGL